MDGATGDPGSAIPEWLVVATALSCKGADNERIV